MRPVKCEQCGEQMYYFGDVQHEPEVEILIKAEEKYTAGGINLTLVCHVHRRCFDNYRIGKLSEVANTVVINGD